MVKNILKISFEGSMGEMYNAAKRTLEIKQYQEGGIFCIYTRFNFAFEEVRKKRELDSNIINVLITSLSSITLPPFPEHFVGCGGGFTEIEVGKNGGKSHHRWWSCPPKGWEELDKITHEIIHYCLDEFDDRSIEHSPKI